MNIIAQGGNTALANSRGTVVVTYKPLAGVELDVSAFLLTANGKVRSDDDMCFYGQTSSKDGAINITSIQPGKTEIHYDLLKLEKNIERVVFTATIFENKSNFSAFSDMVLKTSELEVRVDTKGRPETAMILGELYLRNGVWKFRNVNQGFVGGLKPLATHFGVNIADEPEQLHNQTPKKKQVSLTKKIEAKAPKLVSLAKKAEKSIEKHKLENVEARVFLVLDTSGSMNWQYGNGTVQKVVNRIVPLAVHFDDNGTLDAWAFAQRACKLTPLSLDNYERCVSANCGGWEKWPVHSRGYNNEHIVMEHIINFFKDTQSRTPVFVIFISDGGVIESTKITKKMIEASHYPIFWQFVGIGGSSYGILEHLDNMSGRIIDNCNFFAIDDLNSVSEEELYDRMMAELPKWLKEAKKIGIID